MRSTLRVGVTWTAVILLIVAGSPRIGAQTTVPAPGREHPRILLYHDMEGMAGEDDWRMFVFAHPEQYAKGRELLVADVNAVIDGLFAGGASAVDVVDAHGSGNPEPDIPSAALDRRARQILRDRPFRQYVDLVEPNVYDAVVCVAMHSKSGSRGFAAHTYTLGIELLIDDRPITETELIGYSWGRVGVPVIFGSGDDRLAADLATMPWIEFATVKRATSASTVTLRPLDEARADLRTKARRAVERFRAGEARVMTPGSPVRAAVRVRPPASLAVLRGVPGVNYADERVDFTAPDFGSAYDGMIALVGVATAAYPRVLQETLARAPDGRAALAAYSDSLFMRWMDYESGRWKPTPPPTPSAGRRYHGAR
jgi:D-amino peptidase